MVEIRHYIDRDGRNHFERWFEKLNSAAQARITVSLDRFERGSLSAIKSTGEGVQELRLDFGPGYRVYFGWDGDRLVILLGGGTKKRQPADIAAAKALWREYKERKREERWRLQKPSTKR